MGREFDTVTGHIWNWDSICLIDLFQIIHGRQNQSQFYNMGEVLRNQWVKHAGAGVQYKAKCFWERRVGPVLTEWSRSKTLLHELFRLVHLVFWPTTNLALYLPDSDDSSAQSCSVEKLLDRYNSYLFIYSFGGAEVGSSRRSVWKTHSWLIFANSAALRCCILREAGRTRKSHTKTHLDVGVLSLKMWA